MTNVFAVKARKCHQRMNGVKLPLTIAYVNVG